ncbi:MAG: S41 family peptidase [Myxococcota bacterium]
MTWSGRARARIAPVAAATLWLALGCVTPALPPAAPLGDVADQALRRTQQLYLHDDWLDGRMLIGALEALEKRFDPIRFDPEDDHGTLYVGEARVRVPIAPAFEPDAFRAVLGQALAFVRQQLGSELDLRPDESLELLALRGALASLDRYTTIFSGRGTEDFRIRFSGKLSGIGARIGIRDGQLFVVHVFPESPAERGGLRDGDAIVEIDGHRTRMLDVREAVGQIRGEAGSHVVLTVLRNERRARIEVTRGEVVVPSVEVKRLEEGLGYARISTVSRATPREFRDKVLRLGALRGLVLDLRGNQGGSMLASAALADLFLSRGTILRIVGRKRGPPRRDATLARTEAPFQFPVAVLVDRQTASAAEILAGAIAPLPRVTLIGQRTFGKGLIQRVLPIAGDNLLKLTVAEYRLSHDRAIQGKGIEPDVVLFPVGARHLARLAARPENAIPYVRKVGDEDRFPIEVAERVLQSGADAARETLRELADRRIRTQLEARGIAWEDASAGRRLPRESIEISGRDLRLVMGESNRVQIQVRNTGTVPIPEAWLALRSPAGHPSDPVVSLGTLAPGQSATREVAFEPPDGLASDLVPLTTRVASGTHPLASRNLRLELVEHPPQVSIRIERTSEENVRVSLSNRGARETGPVQVFVPGASRALPSLAPGNERSVELPLGGHARSIAISFPGPRAQRLIEIPLPERSLEITPPELSLGLESFLGRERVVLEASAETALTQGWIMDDGEKRAYRRWRGDRSATLKLGLRPGEHSVRAKVVTSRGVSVLEARLFTVD